MGSNNSKSTFSQPDPVINDSPPMKPEETLKIYQALIKSGEHKRGDLKCLENNLIEQLPRDFSYAGDTSVTRCEGPQMKEKDLDKLEGMYQEWRERLSVKHGREARAIYDRYTTGLSNVQQKFRESEPVCYDLQKALYTCYRQNPEKTKVCDAEARAYIECVSQKASKCFRQDPTHRRVQQSCKVEITPVRDTPRPEVPVVIDSPPAEPREELFLPRKESDIKKTTEAQPTAE